MPRRVGDFVVTELTKTIASQTIAAAASAVAAAESFHNRDDSGGE